MNSTSSGQPNFNAVFGDITATTRDRAITQFTDDAALGVTLNGGGAGYVGLRVGAGLFATIVSNYPGMGAPGSFAMDFILVRTQ